MPSCPSRGRYTGLLCADRLDLLLPRRIVTPVSASHIVKVDRSQPRELWRLGCTADRVDPPLKTSRGEPLIRSRTRLPSNHAALLSATAFPDTQLDRLDELIGPLVTARAPGLLGLYGVGPDTAALLLIAAGDHPERLRSEAAWAHLCGVAPIPASSGKVSRHRLNRGGDREANHALWRIVITRMSSHPATRAYVERRTGEGLS